MLDQNSLKQKSSGLIHTISRLATEIGTLEKIALNFEGIAIVEFTREEGFASSQEICETLIQSRRGPLGALETLESVTIQMTVEIEGELAQVGIELALPHVDRPTLLYVDAPKVGLAHAQNRVLFKLYQALHTPREVIPPPAVKPGSDAVSLLECLLKKAS